MKPRQKEKKIDPKKSTGRDGGQTDSEQDKHLERKKKNSRFRNNRISVLVVLVLLLQHPVLVLVLKQ
jgi:hypothetical protein